MPAFGRPGGIRGISKPLKGGNSMIRIHFAAFLVCLSCLNAQADPANSASESSTAATKQRDKVESPLEKQMLGVKLVVDSDLDRIDKFRTLGMRHGFGGNQPVCDFIATEKWVNTHGTTIKGGDVITIGKATVVEATDGYGNTGTKLILESAAPKEGLVFYCYAFNAEEKAYWATDKRQVQKALMGYFHFAKE
jgi:hypothetical protein